MIQSGIFWLVLFSSVIVFWMLPKQLRFSFLALASFGYLATLDLMSVLVLVAWTLAFYWLAPLAIGKGPWQQRLLPILILAILGYLAYFKYIPPLIAAMSLVPIETHLIIPLGISYFTFKLIHYAVEVVRGNITDRSLSQFFTYIFLFPIFTAGPIERFDHFLANQDQKWQLDSMVEGLTRIIHGLIKKFFIAGMLIGALLGHYGDAAGPNASILLLNLSALPIYKVWGFLILSFLYLYMDFSAYSDIAIGASRLFGIRIMENFNFPIIAPNISNFWKRWHMSLAGWCQAYVYMPMIGLTRNPYIAVYSTMLAFGLWHAGSINRVCWGLYHATGLIIHLTWNRIKRKKKWYFIDRLLIIRLIGIPITFMFVAVSQAFTTTDGNGGFYGALRILAKLFFIDLPVD
ncbi:MBOAT family O-acyltransferase [Candidatus Parabeggiatoa sp. HSG14]|uniref:MBOAT family O-acyltransferase n=1 Tax=Candidatus Parabeggiatoa sp. HSG14 TaxID=3055593 RepID=UPI0025A7D477|nr:MBOAT family O-acyltransferase [Thiotrichales bacterium HSG14]